MDTPVFAHPASCSKSNPEDPRMQLEFPPLGLLHLLALALGRDRVPPAAPPAPSPVEGHWTPRPEPDQERADRAFLLEIMNAHPEAVQSETGMMLLMAQYPKHL
jgi:hypothetical protein